MDTEIDMFGVEIIASRADVEAGAPEGTLGFGLTGCGDPECGQDACLGILHVTLGDGSIEVFLDAEAAEEFATQILLAIGKTKEAN